MTAPPGGGMPSALVPSDEYGSYPALAGYAFTSLGERIFARLIDAALSGLLFLIFFVVMLGSARAESLGGVGVMAGLAFAYAALSLFVLITRATTVGGAILGLHNVDATTGRLAPGKTFLKYLIEWLVNSVSFGLGIIALMVTMKPPLQRHWVDRAVGVVVVRRRPGARSPMARATTQQAAAPFPTGQAPAAGVPSGGGTPTGAGGMIQAVPGREWPRDSAPPSSIPPPSASPFAPSGPPFPSPPASQVPPPFSPPADTSQPPPPLIQSPIRATPQGSAEASGIETWAAKKDGTGRSGGSSPGGTPPGAAPLGGAPAAYAPGGPGSSGTGSSEGNGPSGRSPYAPDGSSGDRGSEAGPSAGARAAPDGPRVSAASGSPGQTWDGGDRTVMRAFEPASAPRIVLDDGAELTIDGATLLGRNPQRPAQFPNARLVPVPDEGRSVSKTHLVVGHDGGNVWVEDLHSTNGVRITVPGAAGPARIPAGERRTLAPGTRVAYGDRSFVVATE